MIFKRDPTAHAFSCSLTPRCSSLSPSHLSFPPSPLLAVPSPPFPHPHTAEAAMTRSGAAGAHAGHVTDLEISYFEATILPSNSLQQASQVLMHACTHRHTLMRQHAHTGTHRRKHAHTGTHMRKHAHACTHRHTHAQACTHTIPPSNSLQQASQVCMCVCVCATCRMSVCMPHPERALPRNPMTKNTRLISPASP